MECLLIAELRLPGFEIDVPGAFQIPGVISVASSVEILQDRRIIIIDWIDGCPTAPFFDLGMTVGEGETASAAVITGGNVLPV